MKLMKILDDETVTPVDALYIDGYGFGDRMLEGLCVKLTLNDQGKLIATADWPKGMDADYWSSMAIPYAMELDVMSASPDLQDDDGFILLETGQD